MFRQGLIIAAIGIGGVAAGCGGDDDEPARLATKPAKQEAAAPKPLDPDKDPYTITCADMKHPDAGVFSRRASNTLALDAKVTNMSQLQAATAIYFGMTEVCKSKPASFKPAKDALAGVKAGKFKSDL